MEIARFKGALLVIVSTRDLYIRPQPQMGHVFIQAHTGDNKLVEIDADHGFNAKSRGAKYLDQAVDATAKWFKETL